MIRPARRPAAPLPAAAPALAALLAGLLGAAPAAAGDMTVLVVNGHDRAVVAELHGETRLWPGGDQLYLFDPGERKTFPIDCREGERICYGAWLYGDDRMSWGVGPENDRACTDCCFTCVGDTIHRLELNP